MVVNRILGFKLEIVIEDDDEYKNNQGLYHIIKV